MSLRLMQGKKVAEVYVGNQVEMGMFAALDGWTLRGAAAGAALSSGTVCSPTGAVELTILQRFAFEHGRQAMSVVVAEGATYKVFAKGSFEALLPMCADPAQAARLAPRVRALAGDGCYVLALAYRECAPLARLIPTPL